MKNVLRYGWAMLLYCMFWGQEVSAQDQPPLIGESTQQILPPILYSSGNGQWNTPNFWSDGNGNFYSDPDDPTVDIVIQTGHTVSLTVGGKSCQSLTVENGATLLASGASNRYINIFGPTLDLLGTVGGVNNGLSFNIESTNCTLQASGNVDISRLRKSVSGNSTQLIVNGNLTLHFNGAALTNQAIGTSFDILLNGVLTVNPGDVSLDGVDGTNSVNQHGSIAINGVLDIVQGDLYAVTDNSSGNDITYQINSGGQLIVGGQVIGNSGVANSAFAEMVNEGSLLLQGSGIVFSNLDLVRNVFSFSNASLTQYNGSNAVVESTLPYGQLGIGGGSAVLNGPTAVGNQLLLLNSILQLGDFDLTLAPMASIQHSPLTTAYVQTNGFGYLRQSVGSSPVSFPVGHSSFNPVHLRTNGSTDSYRVRVLDEVLSEGVSGNVVNQSVVNRSWLIEEQIAGGVLEAEVFWLPLHEGAGFDRQQCYLSHYRDQSWQSDAAAAAQSSGLYAGYYSRQRSNISSLSPFAVASSGILPAEWGELKLARQAQHVRIEWDTQQEFQTDFFVVEWSTDGRNFQEVGQQTAAGYASHQRQYSFLHLPPTPGNQYYRIRLQDLDGSSSWSKVAQIYTEGTWFSIYPNPVQDYLRLQLPAADKITYRILDVSGRVLQQGNCANCQHHLIDIHSFPAGKYFLWTSYAPPVSFIKN